MPRPLAVGVDIGGSKVEAVLLDAERVPRGDVRFASSAGPQGVVEAAMTAVDLLVRRCGVGVGDLAVVGVGVPGLVQRDSGDVSHAVNLGLDGAGLSLGSELAGRLGAPVVVENDVNAAALGAASTLARGEGDLAYLSIGTGLAAGLVTGGKVRHGARGAAGEIGHVPVDPGGPRCACGQRGCLELLASGSALSAAWPVGPGESSATDLFRAASDGDGRARQVRDTFAGHVAAAVRLLVLTCDVETVVLGGGVAEVGDALLVAVSDALRRQAEGSAFVSALDLPSRVALLPTAEPVAAIGAALCGAAALTDVDRAGLTPAVP